MQCLGVWYNCRYHCKIRMCRSRNFHNHWCTCRLGSGRASFRRHVLTFFASFAFLTSTWENCAMLHPSTYVAVSADISSIYVYNCVYIYMPVVWIALALVTITFYTTTQSVDPFCIFRGLPDLPDITKKSEVEAVKDVRHEIVVWLPVIMVPRNSLMP